METCDLTHLFILTDQNTDEERYSSDCLSASLTNTAHHTPNIHTHTNTPSTHTQTHIQTHSLSHRHTHTYTQHTHQYINHIHTQTHTHKHTHSHTLTSLSQISNNSDNSYTTSRDKIFFHCDSLVAFISDDSLIHPSIFSFRTLFHSIHPFSQDFMFIFKSSPSTFCIQQFSASFFKIHSTTFR